MRGRIDALTNPMVTLLWAMLLGTIIVVQFWVLQPRAELEAFLSGALAVSTYTYCDRGHAALPEMSRAALRRFYDARARIVPGITCQGLTDVMVGPARWP